jgi:hypothetical protein
MRGIGPWQRWTGSTVPVHGSTRYIKHQPLEIRSAARIEWGEGVSWSSNLERQPHDGWLTAARTAMAALDDGSWWCEQWLTEASPWALRGAFLHAVWTYGGGASRGTHLESGTQWWLDSLELWRWWAAPPKLLRLQEVVQMIPHNLLMLLADFNDFERWRIDEITTRLGFKGLI